MMKPGQPLDSTRRMCRVKPCIGCSVEKCGLGRGGWACARNSLNKYK